MVAAGSSQRPFNPRRVRNMEVAAPGEAEIQAEQPYVNNVYLVSYL